MSLDRVENLTPTEVLYAAARGQGRVWDADRVGAQDRNPDIVKRYGPEYGHIQGAIGELAARKILGLDPYDIRSHPAGDEHDGFFFGRWSVDVKCSHNPNFPPHVKIDRLKNLKADIILSVHGFDYGDPVTWPLPAVHKVPEWWTILGYVPRHRLEDLPTHEAFEEKKKIWPLPREVLAHVQRLIEKFGPPNTKRAER